MSSKPKELYRETYKAGTAVIRESLLPDRLPYMADGFRIVSMEMRAAGRLDNGQEFQDIRVCLEEIGEEAARARLRAPAWINAYGGGSTCPDGQPHEPDQVTAESSSADLPARCWRCDAIIKLEIKS